MLKLNTLIQERRVLSVFDFDDTIAKSDAWVYVTRAGRITKKLDPAQFAVYKPKPGEDFDFRDFDRKIRNPRLIKQNAELLRKQLDKARRASRGARKVTILTARRLGQPVTSFLKTMGIDAYVVPLGSADPQKKADWIESQIRKGYDTVYFMDDSNKNIAAVNNMLNRYPKVKRRSITKLIKETIQPKKKAIKFSDYLLEQDMLFEIGDLSAGFYNVTGPLPEAGGKRYTKYKFTTDSGLRYDVVFYYTRADVEVWFETYGNVKPEDPQFSGDKLDMSKTTDRGELYKVMATTFGIINHYLTAKDAGKMFGNDGLTPFQMHMNSNTDNPPDMMRIEPTKEKDQTGGDRDSDRRREKLYMQYLKKQGYKARLSGSTIVVDISEYIK